MAVMRVWLGVVCGVAACACAGGAGGARTAMPALLLPDLDQRAPQQVQVVWGGPPDHLQARLAFATNVEDLGWGLPVEDLAGSAVDRGLDGEQVLQGPAGQVGALGEVLA